MEEILEILEQNSRYTDEEIALMVGKTKEEVRKAIDEYVMCIELNKKDYDSYYKVAILLNELEKKE